MKITLLALTSIIILGSCGPSIEETAAKQKAREDSIRIATRLEAETIQKLKEQLTQTDVEKEALENRLMVANADLVAASDKLRSIGEYQFLRTAAERQNQIRNQVIVIQQLQKSIEDVKHEIRSREESLVQIKTQLRNYSQAK